MKAPARVRKEAREEHESVAQEMREQRAPTQRQMMKDHAKRAMRRATEDWVDGRMSTKEHSEVHERAKHVLSGKHPAKFKGKSGSRRPANHVPNGY